MLLCGRTGRQVLVKVVVRFGQRWWHCAWGDKEWGEDAREGLIYPPAKGGGTARLRIRSFDEYLASCAPHLHIGYHLPEQHFLFKPNISK